MRPSATVLTIGSELLDGRIRDSNASYICKACNEIGLSVGNVLSCGDDVQEIFNSLNFLVRTNCEVIIITGGLGPTVDDLTRDAISKFINSPLEVDPLVLQQLRSYIEKRGRSPSKSNDRQAFKPASSNWLLNPIGTAPGIWATLSIDGKNIQIFAIPGVPKEAQKMLKEQVLPQVKSSLSLETFYQEEFQIFGVSESSINDKLLSLNLNNELLSIFSVSFPVIKLIIKGSLAQTKAIQSAAGAIEHEIGKEFIFSRTTSETLAQIVLEELKRQKLTLAVAESCTGGLLGSLITEVSGASTVFMGGIISYANSVKENALKVSSNNLKDFGAVSEQVAIEMAQGTQKTIGSSIGVSITGIAGPDGGSEEKPVGTVWIGFATEDDSFAKKIYVPLERTRVKIYSAYYALNLIRNYVYNK